MDAKFKTGAAGIALGAALALSGASMAEGPDCSRAKLTGVSAQNTVALPDGGVLAGWYGSGRGVAPGGPDGKPVEGDVGCSSPTLGGLEAECLAQWKQAYCK